MSFRARTNIIANIVDIKSLLKNKRIILNIVLLTVAFIVGGYIYSWQGKINADLKEKVILLSRKNELLKKLATLEERLLYYKDLLKKKDVSQVISTFTRLAQESGLKIVSVKPEREKEFSIYTKLSVRLNLLVDNYHKIGIFISKLESSSDIYKIDAFSIKSPEEYGKQEATEEQGAAGLNVELVTTIFAFKG